MKKKRKRIAFMIVFIFIVAAVLSARPVLWSAVSCFNEIGYGKDAHEAFERFPVHMKRYTIKFYGGIMPQNMIMNIIADESEEHEVRSEAVSSLPSDDESVAFLEKIFWEAEDELSYRILQKLWVYGTPAAEDIADEIFADLGKYGPVRICAALIAKENELRENNRGRSEQELICEINSFKKICSDIRDNYDKINNIDRNSISYTEAHDPVKIAGCIFNEIGM